MIMVMTAVYSKRLYTDQTDACGQRTKKSVVNSKEIINHSNIVNTVVNNSSYDCTTFISILKIRTIIFIQEAFHH